MAEQKQAPGPNDTQHGNTNIPPPEPVEERQCSSDYQQIFNSDAEDDPAAFNKFINKLDKGKPQPTAHTPHHKTINYAQNLHNNDDNDNYNDNNSNNNNNSYNNQRNYNNKQGNNNMGGGYNNKHGSNPGKSTQYKWQWNAGKEWKDYKRDDSNTIESQYGSQDQIYMDIFGKTYEINLSQLYQLNINNQKKRQLRRVPVDYKDNSTGNSGNRGGNNNNNKYSNSPPKYNNSPPQYSNSPPKYSNNYGNKGGM
eukprot:172855_1